MWSCHTVWQNTIQHDHAEKFPWNHIFVNSVLKTLIWWKKCWIFRKNSDRVLDDFSTMWVFYSIFPYCTLTKEPYFQKSIWRKTLTFWYWWIHAWRGRGFIANWSFWFVAWRLATTLARIFRILKINVVQLPILKDVKILCVSYLNNLLLVQFLLEVSCTFFDQSRHKCLCMYLQMYALDYLERKYTIYLCALDPVDLEHWSCLKCWCSFEIQMPGLFAYILQEDLIYFSFR